SFAGEPFTKSAYKYVLTVLDNHGHDVEDTRMLYQARNQCMGSRPALLTFKENLKYSNHLWRSNFDGSFHSFEIEKFDNIDEIKSKFF
ncbi:15475_t:CDS:2, partial [Cetraspora pellucida]